MKLFRLWRKIWLFLLLTITVLTYGVFIEPYQLKTEYVTYDYTLSADSLVVVQFSDTHFDKQYDLDRAQAIVEAINAASPDIVVFTGDLFDNAKSYSHTEEIGACLAQITATYGKFAVWGNHDYGGGAENCYERIMTAGGFQVLRNEKVTIDLPGSQTLTIIGLDELLLGRPDYSLLADPPQNPTLLLVHEPDALINIAENSLPFLTLAGHSHGGQVRIPGVGSPIHNVYARTYSYKSYTVSPGHFLYVNTGLGTTTLPIRLGVIPTVTVFTLHI